MTSLVLLALVVAFAVVYAQLQTTRRRAAREAQLREFFSSRYRGAAGPTPDPGAARSGHQTSQRLPGGTLQVTHVTEAHRLGNDAAGAAAVVDDLLGQLQEHTAQAAQGASDGGRFTVEPPGDLPTFADVGGMETLKQELRDTVGLLVRDPDKAAAYGITWNGVLLHGPPGTGKTFLARAVAGEFGLGLLHVSTGDLVEGVVGESARNVQRAFAAAAAARPCLLFFDEFDSLAQRREAGTHNEERRTVNQLLTELEANRRHRDLVVVAATNDLGHIDPAVIRPGRFDRHVRIDLPDAAARRAVLTAQLSNRLACEGVDPDELARRTAGLSPAAITRVVDEAALAAFREASARGDLVRITMTHLLEALTARGGRDRPTIEDWTWDQLVLPPAVEAELRELQALVEDPDVADRLGIDPPGGILLAGPPGTGKTTVARVLAAQARCSFYPVSAADVTSKWVGESEGNIKRLFERARQNRPSIVFIDEIDAIGAQRASAGDGSAARLLNQLLVEMDGLGGSRGVLVIGATNRPELLDPALVRGGRLSRTVTLPLPDAAGRLAILRLHARRMPTVGVDLEAVARATGGLSGAELKALCQQAAVQALVRTRSGGDPDAAVAVGAADFERALSDHAGQQR